MRHAYFLALLLLVSPVVGFARETPGVDSPAFTTVPELSAGFDLLYQQRFAEARQAFVSWESRNPEQPFGQVAIAAGYLFEELSSQGVLTSDFFLNEKRFLHGIEASPDPERMSHFRDAIARACELAKERQKTNPKDGEALLALTLAAGMESDAESILQKRHLAGLKSMKKAQITLSDHRAAERASLSGLVEFTVTKGSVWSRSPGPWKTGAISGRSPKLS